jgi:hypothetical protein
MNVAHHEDRILAKREMHSHYKKERYGRVSIVEGNTQSRRKVEWKNNSP